jgi:hypothetical protein
MQNAKWGLSLALGETQVPGDPNAKWGLFAKWGFFTSLGINIKPQICLGCNSVSEFAGV